MDSNSFADFSERLRQRSALGGDDAGAVADGAERTLRKLAEVSELSPGDFADEVASFYRLPRIALSDLAAAQPLVNLFSRRFLHEMLVFPCRLGDGETVLATGDPSDSAAIKAAGMVLGPEVTVRIGSFEDVKTILNQRLGEDEGRGDDEAGEPAAAVQDIESLRDLASGAPVVRAVNDLFERAFELQASDVHIEPFRNGLTVRYRIDGLLRPVASPAGVLPQAIISRIKIMAGLNIAERRLPQDGAARFRIGKTEIDIRVAIMPTQYGEAAVIRLLQKDRGLLGLEKLGFSPPDEKKLRSMLQLPHGMIAITGPTGSGKTTTLATVLSLLNEPSRKILTVEDPVEYEIPGINQSQIKPAIGLTFAAALRAFMRQDPDVIMVGEVRDGETAHIAVHAALTGHLVLTTVHTETAAAAVPRLLDLGIEAFLLKSTLRAVIAQRLVRCLCQRCRAIYELSVDDCDADPRYAALGLKPGETLYRPTGCERCGGGYRGRMGVYEILEITDQVRDLIDTKCDGAALDRAAIRAGMTTMVADGLAKSRAGLTSITEILRVTTVR